MAEGATKRLVLSLASGAGQTAVYRARHDVYATELRQYDARPDGVLPDAADVHALYIVAEWEGELAGFVGITPPDSPRFSVDRYLQRDACAFAFDGQLYEIRALTVLAPFRGRAIAGALMYAAFRWVEAHGGTRVVAIGRREVLDMYVRAGMERVGKSFSCGAVTYDLMTAEVAKLGGRLIRKLSEGFDLLVWVNPNNPTGLHVSRPEVERVLGELPSDTRVWLDETYVEYAGRDQSMEQFAARSRNVVVCKSLSKVYALSGLRVGYLCGAPHQLEELRPLTPPWAVSLPAQIAATHALRASDYYADRYRQTHELRAQLAEGLRKLGIIEIVPGIANFLMFHLSPDDPDAATVVNKSRKQGLFLRNVVGMGSNLGLHALRIAVKDPVVNRRMLEILKGVLKP